MRTTVKHLMMSFLLIGGLMIAGPATAQPSGRHRPAAGATSSRSSHESRQTDNRRSESIGSQRRSESPRVDSRRTESVRSERRTESQRVESRHTDTRRSESTQGSMRNGRERPSASMGGNHNDRTQTDRTRSTTSMERRSSERGNTGGTVDHNNNRGGHDRNGSGSGYNRDNNRGDRNGNRGGYDRDRDNNRGHDRNGNFGGSDRNRGDRNGSDRNRGGFDRNRDRHDRGGQHHSAGPSRPYNYDRHPHRDHFRNNFSRHDWSRPLPPPRRDWRPVRLRYYRPVVPVHYRPYYGAPVIDRILGITFGTLFNVSLDYLYSNGYYIDGYDTDIVYLRDVSMLNVYWPDVMLSYDAGRLANAQFVYASGYNDRTRYNRIYHDLCGVYGPPVSVDAGIATWFGGNTTGWVTLSLGTSAGRFLTTLSIGY